MANIQNKVVIFTDVKDFTYKTSLLTSKEIEELVNVQENLVYPIVEKYNGDVVKTIGDAFMIVLDSSTNACKLGQEIIKETKNYNKDIQNDLQKIEIRIAINIGEVTIKETLKGYDYFGEVVNIASRILENTPANYIYVSSHLFNTVNKNEVFGISIGEMQFKGIPDKVEVYNIVSEKKFVEDQKKIREEKAKESSKVTKKDYSIDDLPDLSQQKDTDSIIFKYSALSAFLTTQPIPFADLATLTPIHIYMTVQIGGQYGMKLNYTMAKTLFFQIVGVIGFDYINKQLIINFSKIGLPVISGYLIIPLTFGLTYGLGKVINLYFFYKSRDIEVSNDYIKKIFFDKRLYGKELARNKKNDILKIGKNMKSEVYERIKSFKKGK